MDVDKLVQKLANITSKRKKSDDDHVEIQKIESEAALYYRKEES